MQDPELPPASTETIHEDTVSTELEDDQYIVDRLLGKRVHRIRRLQAIRIMVAAGDLSRVTSLVAILMIPLHGSNFATNTFSSFALSTLRLAIAIMDKTWAACFQYLRATAQRYCWFVLFAIPRHAL